MAGFNKVIILGNMTRDPELKYLPSNTAVCDFGLAVNRKWRDKDGNMKEDVCFVDVSAFGKSAEIINQYMTKGKPILVEGRLKYDTWQGQDGSKKSKLSVVAENFQFVGGREGGAGGGGGAPASSSEGPPRGYQNAPAQQRRPAGPAQDDGGGYDAPPPSGEDIPF